MIHGKQTVLTIMIALILAVAGTTAASAANVSWAADPRTNVQVGYVSDEYTLTAASWTGPADNGKARGKGVVNMTIRSKDGKEQITIQGEAEMVAGFVDGKVSLSKSKNGTFELTFEGTYKSVSQEAMGVMKRANGDTYDGEWKADSPEGKGIARLGNGSSYEGSWKAGKPHGYGVARDATGRVEYAGEWNNGMPVTRPGQATKME
jgi:hypothetical protein